MKNGHVIEKYLTIGLILIIFTFGWAVYRYSWHHFVCFSTSGWVVTLCYWICFMFFFGQIITYCHYYCFISCMLPLAKLLLVTIIIDPCYLFYIWPSYHLSPFLLIFINTTFDWVVNSHQYQLSFVYTTFRQYITCRQILTPLHDIFSFIVMYFLLELDWIL